MYLGNSCSTGEFRLGNIASNKNLGADVLGGGNVDKIPSAGRRPLSVAGAQFIPPLQEIWQPMDFQPQPAGGFTGAVGVPGRCGIFPGETSQIVAEFNTKQWVPSELR